MASKTWVYPVAQPVYVTSPFGPRKHPVTGEYKPHNGTDYRARTGTELYAVAAGTVTSMIRNHPVGGNWIEITLDNGYRAGYSHLSRIDVPRIGYKVIKGSIIGLAGDTGSATAAHLHFGMKNRSGAWIDPDAFLRSVDAVKLTDTPSGGETEDDMFTDADRKLLADTQRLAKRLGEDWLLGQAGLHHDMPGAAMVRATNTRAERIEGAISDLDARVGRVGVLNTYTISLINELDERVGRVGAQNTYIIGLQREALAAIEALDAALTELENSEEA